MQKIIDNKIPFACLTNGGGQLELVKTEKLNKAFSKKLFNSAYMFMNHTPLKP
jgi:ribonucleotide monophosphatase NagD (HAD superfamily)